MAAITQCEEQWKERFLDSDSGTVDFFDHLQTEGGEMLEGVKIRMNLVERICKDQEKEFVLPDEFCNELAGESIAQLNRMVKSFYSDANDDTGLFSEIFYIVMEYNDINDENLHMLCAGVKDGGLFREKLNKTAKLFKEHSDKIDEIYKIPMINFLQKVHPYLECDPTKLIERNNRFTLDCFPRKGTLRRNTDL